MHAMDPRSSARTAPPEDESQTNDAGDPVSRGDGARLKRGRYISDPILERRRRMLEVAKAMIAEEGHEGFTVRELGRRAKVSVTTIYATYGDKEGLIAAAIQDYYDRLPVANMPATTTLTGVLKSVDRVKDVILANKPYARQYVSLFFSSTVDPRIYKAILNTATASAGQRQWFQKAIRDDDVVPGLTADYIMRLLANHRLMVLLDWTQGRIADEDLVTATKRSFLVMARGVTRGPTQARVDAELKKLLRASAT